MGSAEMPILLGECTAASGDISTYACSSGLWGFRADANNEYFRVNRLLGTSGKQFWLSFWATCNILNNLVDRIALAIVYDSAANKQRQIVTVGSNTLKVLDGSNNEILSITGITWDCMWVVYQCNLASGSVSDRLEIWESNLAGSYPECITFIGAASSTAGASYANDPALFEVCNRNLDDAKGAVNTYCFDDMMWGSGDCYFPGVPNIAYAKPTADTADDAWHGYPTGGPADGADYTYWDDNVDTDYNFEKTAGDKQISTIENADALEAIAGIIQERWMGAMAFRIRRKDEGATAVAKISPMLKKSGTELTGTELPNLLTNISNDNLWVTQVATTGEEWMNSGTDDSLNNSDAGCIVSTGGATNNVQATMIFPHVIGFGGGWYQGVIAHRASSSDWLGAGVM